MTGTLIRMEDIDEYLTYHRIQHSARLTDSCVVHLNEIAVADGLLPLLLCSAQR